MSAVISKCGKYRYRLERQLREIGKERQLVSMFVMLNPSTADEVDDDNTIRRCREFATSWGYTRLLVCNLFAFRATDPGDLRRARERGEDIIGVDNDRYLRQGALAADQIVCAWGAEGEHKSYLPRTEYVCRILRTYAPLYSIRRTQSGAPEHPLYLPKLITPRLFMEKAR